MNRGKKKAASCDCLNKASHGSKAGTVRTGKDQEIGIAPIRGNFGTYSNALAVCRRAKKLVVSHMYYCILMLLPFCLLRAHGHFGEMEEHRTKQP